MRKSVDGVVTHRHGPEPAEYGPNRVRVTITITGVVDEHDNSAKVIKDALDSVMLDTPEINGGELTTTVEMGEHYFG